MSDTTAPITADNIRLIVNATAVASMHRRPMVPDDAKPSTEELVALREQAEADYAAMRERVETNPELREQDEAFVMVEIVAARLVPPGWAYEVWPVPGHGGGAWLEMGAYTAPAGE